MYVSSTSLALTTLLGLVIPRVVFGTSTSPSYNVSDCPGYKITSVTPSLSGLTASLSLAGPACNAFGTDIPDLVLEVTHETASRLHVHIYDKTKNQFQVPETILSRPGGAWTGASDFEFQYSATNFAFWITRKRTGDIIFDTRSENIPTYAAPLNDCEDEVSVTNSTAMPKHELVFEDQYLQLSSALPIGANIYGLGEYYSGNYRRNPDATLQTFFALDIADPVDENMYGIHAVYQELRKNNATGRANTHAAFLLNPAGMDIILRPGVIQYRAVGGTLDLYFLSGDATASVNTIDGSAEIHSINSAATAIEQYTQTVGLPQIPPTWAFGFHLCRWGYANLSETRDVVKSMRDANIPLEAQWNDIDWMHAYRNFVADPVRFPLDEYTKFIDELHANHQHYIPIIDAAISVQVPNGTDKYDAAVRGLELQTFITTDADANSSGLVGGLVPYVGIVWPGYTYFPDWHAENTQEWWTEAFRNMSSYMKFDGIWLDMNEPASFCTGSCGSGADWSVLPPSVEPSGPPDTWPEGYDNSTYGHSGNITVNGSLTYNPAFGLGPSQRSVLVYNDDIGFTQFDFGSDSQVPMLMTMSNVTRLDYPPYAIHNAYGDLNQKTVAMNATTSLGKFYNVKNLWGFSEELTTHKTLLALNKGKRPFLISRSTFAGSGKYTGHWLGDNQSTWRYLWHSIQGVLQFQSFGIPMVGADTCGFAGNTDEELCNRWMALSAFTPFFRNHNIIHALPQEPYRWDSVAEVSRKVLAARYSLLPLWQTLFARASEHGTPAIRALWQEFPDGGYESADRQFLVGDILLITPVLSPNVSSVQGVFPSAGGPWRDYWTHREIDVVPDVNSTISAPLSHIPVAIRPGKILTQYTTPGYTIYKTQQSPYSLLVALDSTGIASGEFYADDGDTQWVNTAPGKTVRYTASKGKLSATVTEGISKHTVLGKLVEVGVLGVTGKPRAVKIGGVNAKWTYNATTKGVYVTDAKIDLNQGWNITWS